MQSSNFDALRDEALEQVGGYLTNFSAEGFGGQFIVLLVFFSPEKIKGKPPIAYFSLDYVFTVESIEKVPEAAPETGKVSLEVYHFKSIPITEKRAPEYEDLCFLLFSLERALQTVQQVDDI